MLFVDGETSGENECLLQTDNLKIYHFTSIKGWHNFFIELLIGPETYHHIEGTGGGETQKLVFQGIKRFENRNYNKIRGREKEMVLDTALERLTTLTIV